MSFDGGNHIGWSTHEKPKNTIDVHKDRTQRLKINNPIFGIGERLVWPAVRSLEPHRQDDDRRRLCLGWTKNKRRRMGGDMRVDRGDRTIHEVKRGI